MTKEEALTILRELRFACTHLEYLLKDLQNKAGVWNTNLRMAAVEGKHSEASMYSGAVHGFTIAETLIRDELARLHLQIRDLHELTQN